MTGRRKMESEILSRSGFQQASIAVEGIKGRGWKKGMMVAAKLPWSFFQALGIIRRFSPHVVFGVGGYSAGPVCLAAKVMGVPSAIHEQNSFPGLTNRLLCKRVDRVFISFEESRKHFPGGTLLLTGNPIRRELLVQEGHRSRDKRPIHNSGHGGESGSPCRECCFRGGHGSIEGTRERRLRHSSDRRKGLCLGGRGLSAKGSSRRSVSHSSMTWQRLTAGLTWW